MFFFWFFLTNSRSRYRLKGIIFHLFFIIHGTTFFVQLFNSIKTWLRLPFLIFITRMRHYIFVVIDNNFDIIELVFFLLWQANKYPLLIYSQNDIFVYQLFSKPKNKILRAAEKLFFFFGIILILVFCLNINSTNLLVNTFYL